MIEIHDKPATGATIRLHPADNVVVARADLAIGARLDPEGLTSRSQVPAGHKIAVRPIRQGEPIVKYNVTIGFAAADIAPGTWVHAHNMEFREFDRDYAFCQDYQPVQLLPEAERASFLGIVRANGQVGTRNYIGVLSTVNCSATVVHRIAAWFTPERLAEFPNVDGVVAFAHGTGCGMEQTGEPMDLLRRTLGGYARHANLAGCLVVGLGCERNQVSSLLKEQALEEGSRLRAFVMQDTGGTRRTIEAGIAAVREMLPEANRVTRRPVLAGHLTLLQRRQVLARLHLPAPASCWGVDRKRSGAVLLTHHDAPRPAHPLLMPAHMVWIQEAPQRKQDLKPNVQGHQHQREPSHARRLPDRQRSPLRLQATTQPRQLRSVGLPWRSRQASQWWHSA